MGAMVISLDFELIWGVFDKVSLSEKEEYFKNTKAVIPSLLKLFERYEIASTWAIVGMLYNKNWEEWNINSTLLKPEYSRKELDAYRFGQAVQGKYSYHAFFAPEIIQQIKQTPLQEIGTHTYCHYYCLEEGQSPEEFRADLEKSIELASRFEVKIESLVFPRNQFNQEYLKICYENGIKNVRSNPNNWYWSNPQKDSMCTKIFRTGDAYLGLNNKSYDISELQSEGGVPLAQKASRLLKPYSPNRIVNALKLRRLKSEMTYAAKNKEIYHLWWHPHNFGFNPEENFRDLEVLLKHFKECQRKYNFRSMNMREINKEVNG